MAGTLVVLAITLVAALLVGIGALVAPHRLANKHGLRLNADPALGEVGASLRARA